MSNWFADRIGDAAGAWTYYFGGGKDAEAQGKQLDQQLQDMNAAQYARGGYTDAQYALVVQDQNSGQTGDVLSQIEESGQQGANAGLDNMKSGVNSAFGSLFGLVPASVWLVAGVALFVYLGGLKWLLGKARLS
jgi:hypothetical protein